MIDEEILKRYGLRNGMFKNDEETLCRTFLKITDYVVIKIVEGELLNVEVENYQEILSARNYARNKVRELQLLKETENSENVKNLTE